MDKLKDIFNQAKEKGHDSLGIGQDPEAIGILARSCARRFLAGDRSALKGWFSAIDTVSKLDDIHGVGFREILHSSIELLSLTEKDVSRVFTVSRPTVQRWMEGKTAPHPLARIPIYDYFREQAKKLIS